MRSLIRSPTTTSKIFRMLDVVSSACAPVRKGVFHSFVCDLLKMFVVASRQIDCCSIWVFHLSLKLPGRSTCLAICKPPSYLGFAQDDFSNVFVF